MATCRHRLLKQFWHWNWRGFRQLETLVVGTSVYKECTQTRIRLLLVPAPFSKINRFTLEPGTGVLFGIGFHFAFGSLSVGSSPIHHQKLFNQLMNPNHKCGCWLHSVTNLLIKYSPPSNLDLLSFTCAFVKDQQQFQFQFKESTPHQVFSATTRWKAEMNNAPSKFRRHKAASRF